jgi:hypothetical protein
MQPRGLKFYYFHPRRKIKPIGGSPIFLVYCFESMILEFANTQCNEKLVSFLKTIAQKNRFFYKIITLCGGLVKRDDCHS